MWQLCDESLSPTRTQGAWSWSLPITSVHHLSEPWGRRRDAFISPLPPPKMLARQWSWGEVLCSVWTFSDWSNQSITKSLVIDTLAYNPLEWDMAKDSWSLCVLFVRKGLLHLKCQSGPGPEPGQDSKELVLVLTCGGKLMVGNVWQCFCYH